jgi:hypothetical protein
MAGRETRPSTPGEQSHFAGKAKAGVEKARLHAFVDWHHLATRRLRADVVAHLTSPD